MVQRAYSNFKQVYFPDQALLSGSANGPLLSESTEVAARLLESFAPGDPGL